MSAGRDLFRTLEEINPATGLPWICVTHETHTCSGPVIGAVGAVPVCEAGATAETRARRRADLRWRRYARAHAGELAAEAAAERRFESGIS
jgi:hypothetical protein